MPFGDYIKASFLMIAAQAFILSGVFFISGQLFTQGLMKFYASTTPFVRTLICSVVLFPLGNFFVAMGFKYFNPAYVTPLNLAIVVLMNIFFTVLILNARPSWHIIPATLVVMAGCVWVGVLLNQKAG